jgi:hypothetical protein
MSQLKNYALRIDGQLLRNQRSLLLKLLGLGPGNAPVAEGIDDKDLLEGLLALLDEISDQAHDLYGIDCLLEEAPDENGPVQP